MAENFFGNVVKSFIEAGLKLTDRDLMRGKFIMASATVPEGGSRLTAADNFLADILADPEKAASSAPFFRLVPGLELEQQAEVQGLPLADILPWGFQGLAGPEAASGFSADIEGLDLVLDFQGRIAALQAGAAVAGAADFDERFVYTRFIDGRPIMRDEITAFEIDQSAIKLPFRANKVLVLGFVRAFEIMGMNPGLSRLRPPEGWLDWPGQVRAVLKLASALASRGYLALPSAGGLVMADHYGALAGLGELGRQGLLITPEYGPNLRLFTIITDYPFISDKPAAFGVADYCETCQRCINECPAKALTEGHRRPGLFQWPVNRRACFDNWLEKRDPCRKCIEICPYTREPLVGSPGGAHRPPLL